MYRNRTAVVAAAFVCLWAAAAAAAVQQDDNGLLDKVLDTCALGPGAVRCLKDNVLEFLEAGGGGREGRADGMADSDIDAELVKATSRYVERQVFEVNVVPGATLVVRPGRAMDNGAMDIVPQQASTTTTTARGLDILNLVAFLKVLQALFKLGQALVKLKTSELNIAFIPFVADMEMGMMQDKMLMPLMMMMKMKLKMLMPIMMAIVSMKATKALILSKVAIILVLGFLVKEFLKKSGIPGLPMIHLPGFPGPTEPSTTTSHPMYGPPQSSGYESGSSWEPTGYSSGHPSDTSHSMAYSSYLPSSSSGSSSSSSATKY